jgi:metallophosphoesterase (TIGR00282 family)
MRLLFLGDIVGRSGREAALTQIPLLKDRLKLDFIIVNAENAAAGFGLTAKIADQFFAVGVDCLTTGNHAWDQRELLTHINTEKRILRPLNFPPSTPGSGCEQYTARNGKTVMVMNVMGRVFMDPLADPFAAVGAELNAAPLKRVTDMTIIDFHGEATSEKMAMGHYCDGRATLVVGTHSHIPTADAQLLPGGTAYQTDAGMCGDYDSVIGMEKVEPIRRFITKLPGSRFEPAKGPGTICGTYVESDDATGLATRIEALRIGPRLKVAIPEV